MDSRRHVPAKIKEIVDAMEAASDECRRYLDMETGEVLMIMRFSDLDEDDEIELRIAADPDRYVAIPRIESYKAWAHMADFADTVLDPRLRELLEVALNGKGAFRRFKDVLVRYPQERERWFAFEAERIRRHAEEWLEAKGLWVDP